MAGKPGPVNNRPTTTPITQHVSNGGIEGLLRGGFTPVTDKPKRRLMIGTDGPVDTGKTEFIMSIPGPGALICIDRGIEGVLQNDTPPKTRRTDWVKKVISIPGATQLGTKEGYLEYWNVFKQEWYGLMSIPELRVIALDGDSDTWELQRLAEFGRIAQVPDNLYTNVNSARRVLINKAFDSGKTVIATSKIRPVYADKLDPVTGQALTTDGGRPLKVKVPGEYDTQGFRDKDYLWQIWLRHMYKPPAYSSVLKREVAGRWGIRITKCKQNRELEGMELWGDDCNFAGLVSAVFPNVPLEDWGF